MYRSVITNTSKEMSCFSDFPFPEDFPSYLPHSLVLEYLRMYARHFGLLQHIRFQVSSEPKPRGDKSQGWLQIGDRAGASPQAPRAFGILNAAFRPRVLNKAA